MLPVSFRRRRISSRARSHHDQVGFHAFAVRVAGGVDHLIEGGVAVGDLTVLGQIYVVQGPGVFEGGAGGLAADGGGVIAVGIEGRVEVDQIDAGGVHAAHDGEVIARPDGSVAPVARAVISRP